MENGIFFYWLCWVLWVITTFFMRKSRQRTLLSCWILLSISISNIYLISDVLEFSVTFIVILTGSFIFLSSMKKMTFHLIASFTMMVGYSSMLIWEKQVPLSLFGPRFIMLPVICVLLVITISKFFYSRIAISLVGMCGGEFLYSLILSNYHVPNTIGDMMFLDQLLIVLFTLIILNFIQVGLFKLKKLFPKHNRSLNY